MIAIPSSALRRGLLGGMLAFLIAIPAAAEACTLYEVVAEAKADLVVYFTKFPKEDTTGGKYKTCRIVKKAEADSKSFRITPFRQDANVVVLKSNWPG